MNKKSDTVDLSVVLPCLNEAHTVGVCIQKIDQSLKDQGLAYEIIVADNGSTDRSAEIAVQHGARLVAVTDRGYGAAIQGGIAASRGEYVIFVDADDTYLLEQTHELYLATKSHQADMGLACRLGGQIEAGAMPVLHRLVGTPVLTWLINLFFGGRVRDCNSGFRCLRRSAYSTWGVHASGMEFASELLIKAKKTRARTIEIPSGLRCGPPERVAHLKTWRDGMRNLLFILSEKPQFFEYTGLAAVILSTLLQIATAILGPLQILGLNIFNLHSQAFLFLAGLTGLQFYLFSCYIYLGGCERPLALTRKLVHLDEGVLFFVLVACLAGEALVFAVTLILWIQAHFSGIYLIDRLLPCMHLLTLPMMTSIGLTGIHVFKRNALFKK
jgi:glycosyltransferase involved in cell wall biosynthesis